MSLYQILFNSKECVSTSIIKKGKEHYSKVFIYAEIFDLFLNILNKDGDISINDLPELPERLADANLGIYRNKNADELFVFYEIPKGQLKYIAMYSSNHFGASILAKELSGVYIAILKKCSEKPLVYSPYLFTYFYTPVENKEESYTKRVTPILALDHDLLPQFIPHWVYLAVRDLSQKHFNDIKYSYLLEGSTQDQLIFLKENGFLDF